jgi:uncharacterized membrane protein
MQNKPEKNEKKLNCGFSFNDITQAIYLSQVLVIFFGITPIIGIILNIIKRNEITSNPFLKAHFDYQFKTFIAWIVMIGIGFLLAILVVGIPIIFAAFIWMIYRGIRGWLAFREGKLPPVKKQMENADETTQ